MNNENLLPVWKNLLAAAENSQNSTGKSSFQRWMRQVKPASLTDTTLTIDVPNNFTKDWLENHFVESLQEDLSMICNRPMKLEVQVVEEKKEEGNLFPDDAQAVPPAPLKAQFPKPAAKQPTQEFQSNLSPKYVFENFVIGNSNRIAHAAALAVANNPAKAYNPFFLYSDSGLGKTHLMNAIGNRIHQNHPEMKILYTSSEVFTNELIGAIQSNKTEAFRNKYRNIDVLLIDDIQFLRKKESTQEEFFHTFETLYKAEKQIIISSDRKPSELDTLEERLTSRFEWGLTVDIQHPDLETRMAILRNMAQNDHIDFPNDVILMIASSIQTNIRELEGAYTKVRAFADLTHQPIDLELTRKALKDLNITSTAKIISVEAIQQMVASEYKIRVDDLKAKKRTRNVVYPRQIAMYLAREMTDLSLPRIGESFGGRDHTTVIHACEKIAKERQEDAILDRKINDLIAELKK
ncbi:chromosomal replication initiator protein DnaA [Acidaminococcus provencensis]|jgi:chromosomal replication initiator protein|uniref:chromosomal replication initiator protein DnaA n=1 Tax=Acidaminococcus provencensis TaxID=2058289 RepID=UPI0022E6D273|nr:chromosomal replication initiator protein DnaA [Acidaminococcus provencensis]